MPNLEIAPSEAETIANFLTGRQSFSAQALNAIFGSRRGIAVSSAGMVTASLSWFLLSFLVRGLKNRRRRFHDILITEDDRGTSSRAASY